MNNTWATNFPKLIQNSLPRLGSDHTPIRLEVGMHCSKPRPFRYEVTWSTTEGFNELVHQWWSELTPMGCGAFRFAKKMVGLRVKLRHWAKYSFGSIKLRKLNLLQEMEALDIVKETRILTLEKSRQELLLLEKLGGDS